jgi:prolyl 4-hydroxylase
LEEGTDGDGYGGWCKFVDCDEEWENGVTFRAVEGNAVFWENLKEDGMGDERTLHKGVKVESGEKVGMNIWTREGPLSAELRGGS